MAIRRTYTKEKVDELFNRKIESGTAVFNNSTTVNITFIQTYDTIPRIFLTCYVSGKSLPSVLNLTTTGFTLQYGNKQTVEIQWMALRR